MVSSESSAMAYRRVGLLSLDKLRGVNGHVVSMRKANERCQTRIAPLLVL
jgi:hypothetical protein